ncbi:hypothetical protein CVT24_005958 [Panaeolus cyanescens]|uniref:Uncharacterized protein n=1 Tax=Panaeolus cyanescens TaxID=181874 RepID=A0A409YE37_9AGAR|nr:hypothetical protein CVT24_005958 [Panaeolus cyanescens]
MPPSPSPSRSSSPIPAGGRKRHKIQKERKQRKDSKDFTPQELDIMWHYKAKFRQIPGKDADARNSYIVSNVFPAMEKHWRELGSAERLLDGGGIVELWQQKIKSYVRRNWRSRIPAYPLKAPTLRITTSNFVYNTQRKKVIEEIRSIMGQDDITMKDISRLRHQAVRNIIESLSDEESIELQNQIDKAKVEGYSPSIQKRIYNKRCHTRISQSSRLQYAEMGIVSLQITAFIGADGLIVIEAHDYAADRLNVQANNFVTEHASEVESLGVLYEKYLKTLLSLQQARGRGPGNTRESLEPRSNVTVTLESRQGPADVSRSQDAPEEQRASEWTQILPDESSEDHAARVAKGLLRLPLDGRIPLTNDGFPILPSPWPKTLPKKTLDKYYQRYMYAHYSLARGILHSNKSFIPWKALLADYPTFYHPTYLPDNLPRRLKDARGTTQETIHRFLQHVALRQSVLGPRHAFRFHRIFDKDAIDEHNPFGAIQPKYPDGVVETPKDLPRPSESSTEQTFVDANTAFPPRSSTEETFVDANIAFTPASAEKTVGSGTHSQLQASTAMQTTHPASQAELEEGSAEPQRIPGLPVLSPAQTKHSNLAKKMPKGKKKQKKSATQNTPPDAEGSGTTSPILNAKPSRPPRKLKSRPVEITQDNAASSRPRREINAPSKIPVEVSKK